MKPRLLEILQHTLGMDQYGRGQQYRNHFVAGTVDALLCDELVALGLMERSKRRGFEGDALTGGMPCYFVTEEGRRQISIESPKPPKISRGRRRYLAFLDADPSCSFGEWLKCGGGRAV